MEPVEPGDIAEVVFDRVMDFCTKIHDQPLECIADHNPDQLVSVHGFISGRRR